MGHTNASATLFGMMDDLSYTYDSGNKLTQVDDASGKAERFKNVSGVDYTYDVNGNMISDNNKGISSITYNHLNLPTKVSFPSQQASISYVYDATGAKQKKVVTGMSVGTTTTKYAGNYIYEDDVLQFFSHSEGYIKQESGKYGYIYQYKDHLGNVRLTYSDDSGDGKIQTLTNTGNYTEVIEDNNYYPFGLKHKGYNDVILSTNVGQNFKYNGKELDEDLGINLYHYGFRLYDPILGRFPSIDPASDQFPHVSTYNYAENEPAGSIDLWGLQQWKVNGRERLTGFSKEEKNGAMFKFAVYNIRMALRLEKPGPRNQNSNSISMTATRLSRGIARGKETESNPLQHAIAAAMATVEFGEERAERALNAREGLDAVSSSSLVDTSDTSIVDLNQEFKGNRSAADSVADLLNNQIGIEVGHQQSIDNKEKKQKVNPTDLVKELLYIYKTKGLFTLSEDGKGGFKVYRDKITQNQYNTMLEKLSKLDENGKSKD